MMSCTSRSGAKLMRSWHAGPSVAVSAGPLKPKYSPSVMIGASVCCCKSRSAACTSAKAGGWPSDRVRKCSTSNCSVSLPSGSQSAAK